MNLVFKYEHPTGASVTIDQLQFNWNDMMEFGEWCVENDALPTDGVMLADYLKQKHNIEIL